MKLICPRCRKEIPPDRVNVAQNVAHCAECNEAFDLSALAEGDRVRVERPPNAKSLLERGSDQLAIALPRGGLRGPGCFFLFFTLFWNAITWTFVVVMLSSLFSGTTRHITLEADAPPATPAKIAEAPPGADPTPPAPQAPQGRSTHIAFDAVSTGFDIFGLLFLIPFVLIGLVTAVIALFCLFGETTLAFDRETGIVRRKLFRWKYDTRFRMSDLTDVKLAEAYRQNDVPVYGVGLVVSSKKRSLVFGSHLADDEKHWLVSEIYSFWKETPAARPA
jgi:hypothetical protein